MYVRTVLTTYHVCTNYLLWTFDSNLVFSYFNDEMKEQRQHESKNSVQNLISKSKRFFSKLLVVCLPLPPKKKCTRVTSILGEVRNVQISRVTQQLRYSKSNDFLVIFVLGH